MTYDQAFPDTAQKSSRTPQVITMTYDEALEEVADAPLPKHKRHAFAVIW